MFANAWTLMRIRGIPIRLHVSLLLVLPFLAYTVATNQLPMILRAAHVPPDALTLPASVLGSIVAVGLFVGIALHELGHALVAMRQGGTVKSITLMVLGGVAQIDHEAATPRQQATMAFAGPLVSLVLAGVSIALSRVDALWLDLRAGLFIFGGMNLALAIFNLVPAYPLDGGRILRALLSTRMPQLRATRFSASVGRVLALTGAGFALMHGDPMLLLVSVFVFMGASADEAATTMRLGLTGLRARQAMGRRVASVDPGRPLSTVARHMLFQGASAAIVRDERGVRGVLSVRDVQRGPAKAAGEVLKGEPIWAHVDDDLSEVVVRVQKSTQSGAIVVDDMNTIVGVVTYEDLARVMALRGAADVPGSLPVKPTVRLRQDAGR